MPRGSTASGQTTVATEPEPTDPAQTDSDPIGPFSLGLDPTGPDPIAPDRTDPIPVDPEAIGPRRPGSRDGSPSPTPPRGGTYR